MTSARVIRRREQRLSPWVTLVEKEVAFSPVTEGATYHAFKQADYVGVLAMTPSGLTPLIRQFRPAIERYTWELPGGLLEPGEEPAACARRELREEVGLTVRQLHSLGVTPAEVGRLENHHHMFFAETEEPEAAFVPEPGTTVELVSGAELEARIRAGALDHPLHLALIFLHRLGLARS
jgi:ADP-ribose pyrophosphatase